MSRPVPVSHIPLLKSLQLFTDTARKGPVQEPLAAVVTLQRKVLSTASHYALNEMNIHE